MHKKSSWFGHTLATLIMPHAASDDDTEEMADWNTAGLGGLNTALQAKLEGVFSPLGVSAFSRCCHFGCTRTYSDKLGWRARSPGIFHFCLYLDGMNYNPYVTDVYVAYKDIEHIRVNWGKELELIELWCDTIGAKCLEVVFPATEAECIHIKLKDALELEDDGFDDDDDNDEEKDEVP